MQPATCNQKLVTFNIFDYLIVKSTYYYIKKHSYFILFLFIFSWILTLKNKIGSAFVSSWEDFVFHFDAPFWVFLNALIIFLSIDFIRRKSSLRKTIDIPRIKDYLKLLIIGFIAYIIYISLFSIVIGLIFGTLKQNFASSWHIVVSLFSSTFNFLLFGSLSLAYLYFNENRKYQQRINDYDISISKGKIQQLKSQLNPHFLFNNLNILDQLIEEDKDEASEFLGQFSEVYRYSLSSSDKELIPLSDELSFAQNYFAMMEKKYQGYYKLTLSHSIQNLNVLVPPFCLQVLVENAIVHNLGTTSDPVTIEISNDKGIKVVNNKISNDRAKKGNGVALKNLSEQFFLLTGKPITIDDSKFSFSVTLPLIKMHNND